MTDPRFVVMGVTLDARQSRTQSFMGRPFRVIPAVLLRSQVVENNLGRVLTPAAAFTDEWANAWNGIPVLVGPHPTMHGQPVSGRSPELWEERGAGWLFNVRVDQESAEIRRLLGEAWIDESRAPTIAGLPEVLERVSTNAAVELSTGFAAQVDAQQGTFQGAEYDAILTPLNADHLVVSTEMTGACSVRAGCGLGVRNSEEIMTTEKVDAVKASTVLERVAEFLRFTPKEEKASPWSDNVARNVQRQFVDATNLEASDQERANFIRHALQTKLGGSDREVVITDVFSDAKQVVFWYHTPHGCVPPGAEFFRVLFTEAEGGFTFTEPERVRRMTSYEPVGAALNAAPNHAHTCGCATQEDTMNENDKKELMKDFGEVVANAMTPVLERMTKIENGAKEVAEAVVNAAKAEFKSQFDALSAKVDGALKVVNAERDAERQALVTELSTNERTQFSATELESKPLEELRKIAHLAKVDVTQYSGRGAPRAIATNADEPSFAEPVPYHKSVEKTGEK